MVTVNFDLTAVLTWLRAANSLATQFEDAMEAPI